MKKIYSLLHFAVILAAFTGIFGKLISLNEGLLVWYRVLFSAIILFALIKISRVKVPAAFGDRLQIAKIGVLIIVHWLFFYASIKYSNVSVGVVCYCLTSCFTAVLKPLTDRTAFRYSELMLSSLTLVGISLIFHFDVSYRAGILMGVVSSAFAALYTIYNERLVRKYDSLSINYYQMLGGLACLSLLLPAYLYFSPAERYLPDSRDSLYLVLLSLFCTVGLYVSVSEILKKVSAFTVNLTFNLEPIYAIMLAFLLFGEGKEVGTSFYAGLVLVIISVVLQTLLSIKKQKMPLKA